MRIICPNCETTYQLGDGALGATGRKVRCARCGTVWHAMPAEAAQWESPEPDETPPPPPRAEPSDDEWKEALAGDGAGKADGFADGFADAGPAQAAEPAAEPAAATARLPATVEPAGLPDGLDAPLGQGGDGPVIDAPPPGFEPEKRSEDKVRLKSKRKKSRVSAVAAIDKHLSTPVSFGLMAVGLALFVLLGFFGRAQIVRMVPDFAGLYELIGLEVNLRGMDFTEVKTHREMDGGTPVLVIDGTIVNLEARSQKLPSVRITLKSATGRDVYAWNYTLPQSAIEPSGNVYFKTRLLAPPEAATIAEVRFTDQHGP